MAVIRVYARGVRRKRHTCCGNLPINTKEACEPLISVHSVILDVPVPCADATACFERKIQSFLRGTCFPLLNTTWTNVSKYQNRADNLAFLVLDRSPAVIDR